jgi:hypothetical protein
VLKHLFGKHQEKRQTIFASSLQRILDNLDDGITALNAGPDGSLYIAGWNSILKVTTNGKVSILTHPVVVSECDEDPADHKEENRGKPLLRGIDIDSTGDHLFSSNQLPLFIKDEQRRKSKHDFKS